MTIQRFKQGPVETIARLNDLVGAINKELLMQGDIFIRVVHGPHGTTFRLNIDEVFRRQMRYRGGEGRSLRRAFVKTTPGATTTLVCFLDVDTTGTQVNVECDIYGGGNLDEAHPAFVDGDPLWVAYNVVAGEWQNVTRIDGGEICDT